MLVIAIAYCCAMELPSSGESISPETTASTINALENQQESILAAPHPAKQQLGLLRNLAEAYSEASLLESANKVLHKEMLLRARYDSGGMPESWLLLGDNLRRQGQYTQAASLIARAIKALEKRTPSDPERLAAAFNYLALLDNSAGDYVDSEKNARKALALSREANMPESTAAMHIVVLANALRQQGKYEEARVNLESALPTLKTQSKNKGLIAAATNNLGAIYFWMGNYQKALSTLEDGKRMRLEIYGEDHPDVANSLLDIGCTEFRLGQTEAAINDLKNALSIRTRKLGLLHPETLSASANLAVTLNSVGMSKEALPLLAATVSGAKKALGKRHPDLAQYEDDYANVLMSEKHPEQATRQVLDAMSIRKMVFGIESREYAASLRSLAHIYEADGKSKKSLLSLEQSAAVYKGAGQKADQDYADTLEELATAYLQLENLQKAHDLYLEIVAKRAEGGQSVAHAVSLANLSEILVRLKRDEESRKMLERAIAVIKSLPENQRNQPDCTAITERYKNLTANSSESTDKVPDSVRLGN